MRTGAEYREALRDGRRVWVLGEGLVEDVTTHPATSAVVEEYALWYDRHFDPAWGGHPDRSPIGRPRTDSLGLRCAEDVRGSDRHRPE
jgi:hypothetical protein